MQCVIYISNKSQYLKNEERYGKTINGVPLSFPEFFQIRQLNFHFIYTLKTWKLFTFKHYLEHTSNVNFHLHVSPLVALVSADIPHFNVSRNAGVRVQINVQRSNFFSKHVIPKWKTTIHWRQTGAFEDCFFAGNSRFWSFSKHEITCIEGKKKTFKRRIFSMSRLAYDSKPPYFSIIV